MGPENKERSLQKFCYRDGAETGDLDMEERRQAENLDLAYLLHCSTCFSGRLGWRVSRECLLALASGRVGSVVERKCEESWSKEVGAEKKGRLNQVVW